MSDSINWYVLHISKRICHFSHAQAMNSLSKSLSPFFFFAILIHNHYQLVLFVFFKQCHPCGSTFLMLLYSFIHVFPLLFICNSLAYFQMSPCCCIATVNMCHQLFPGSCPEPNPAPTPIASGSLERWTLTLRWAFYFWRQFRKPSLNWWPV